MNRKISTLGTTSLAFTFFLFASCGGNTTSSNEELEVGEAEAYISVAEDDSDDPTEDALPAASDEDVGAIADEDAAEEDPASADALQPCEKGYRRQQVIATYDADGDGALDATERAVLRADIGDKKGDHPKLRKLVHKIRHHRFHLVRWAYDADASGDLDETERAELVADAEARCTARRTAILTQFDADGSGKLEGDELVAFRQARRERIGEKMRGIMMTFDTNGDRKLDMTERQAMKDAAVQKLKDKRAELKAKFDANGDGSLDDTEKAALKDAVKNRFANPKRPAGGA